MNIALQQQINTYCNENLDTIADLLNKLSPEAYQKQEEWLFGSSIGQHTRHILEFYQCLLAAQTSGVANYDLRKRNLALESSPEFAHQTIQEIKEDISRLDASQKLCLEVNHHFEEEDCIKMESTFARELAYCLEHSIHHQALIKVGLQAQKLSELVDETFGVAPATIRYYKR
jgi:uncharacterized damage-inducible protein DinB